MLMHVLHPDRLAFGHRLRFLSRAEPSVQPVEQHDEPDRDDETRSEGGHRRVAGHVAEEPRCQHRREDSQPQVGGDDDVGGQRGEDGVEPDEPAVDFGAGDHGVCHVCRERHRDHGADHCDHGVPPVAHQNAQQEQQSGHDRRGEQRCPESADDRGAPQHIGVRECAEVQLDQGRDHVRDPPHDPEREDERRRQERDGQPFTHRDSQRGDDRGQDRDRHPQDGVRLVEGAERQAHQTRVEPEQAEIQEFAIALEQSRDHRRDQDRHGVEDRHSPVEHRHRDDEDDSGQLVGLECALRQAPQPLTPERHRAELNLGQNVFPQNRHDSTPSAAT